MQGKNYVEWNTLASYLHASVAIFCANKTLPHSPKNICPGLPCLYAEFICGLFFVKSKCIHFIHISDKFYMKIYSWIESNWTALQLFNVSPWQCRKIVLTFPRYMTMTEPLVFLIAGLHVNDGTLSRFIHTPTQILPCSRMTPLCRMLQTFVGTLTAASGLGAT